MALSNRVTRIIVALISIPLILTLCYLGGIPFLLFSLAIGLMAFHEFASMVKEKGHFVNLPLGFTVVAALIFNQYYFFADTSNIIFIFSILLFLSELFRNKNSAISNTGSTLVGVFYIGLFASSIEGIREIYASQLPFYDNGGFLIIALLIGIWVCDSGAYFVGSAMGKHKLFPRVSPNKSWEGAIAGFIFSIVALVAVKSLLLSFLSLFDVVILGIIVGSIGQIGDLIESLFKRDAGVKDSSALIPGHGGIFDRFDSLIFTAPFVFLYLKYFII